MNNIENRIQACEAENTRLRNMIARQNRIWVVALLFIFGGGAIASTTIKSATFDSVKAKEIVVVDANGIVRARLGGDLPDAVLADGKVLKRGSKAGGLIIYDEEGVERGGYVTQEAGSNAMLTLDSKFHQSALFVAGPGSSEHPFSGGALRLWTDKSAIELRSDTIASRLSVSDNSGVTLQQPSIVSLPPETCAEYKKYQQESPNKRYCQARFTDSAYQACFQSN